MDQVRCPQCGTSHRYKPEYEGRKVRCSGCSLVFRLQMNSPPPQAPPPLPFSRISMPPPPESAAPVDAAAASPSPNVRSQPIAANSENSTVSLSKSTLDAGSRQPAARKPADDLSPPTLPYIEPPLAPAAVSNAPATNGAPVAALAPVAASMPVHQPPIVDLPSLAELPPPHEASAAAGVPIAPAAPPALPSPSAIAAPPATAALPDMPGTSGQATSGTMPAMSPAPPIPRPSVYNCFAFYCTCGADLRARLPYRGKLARCPRCKSTLTVPEYAPPPKFWVVLLFFTLPLSLASLILGATVSFMLMPATGPMAMGETSGADHRRDEMATAPRASVEPEAVVAARPEPIDMERPKQPQNAETVPAAEPESAEPESTAQPGATVFVWGPGPEDPPEEAGPASPIATTAATESTLPPELVFFLIAPLGLVLGPAMAWFHFKRHPLDLNDWMVNGDALMSFVEAYTSENRQAATLVEGETRDEKGDIKPPLEPDYGFAAGRWTQLGCGGLLFLGFAGGAVVGGMTAMETPLVEGEDFPLLKSAILGAFLGGFGLGYIGWVLGMVGGTVWDLIRGPRREGVAVGEAPP